MAEYEHFQKVIIIYKLIIQACTNHVENMWKNAKISHNITYRALWNAEKSTIIVFARINVETTIWKESI